MRTLLTGVLLSAVMTLASNAALGHEEFRVIGTLTKGDSSVIHVQSRDGSVKSIRLDRQTLITKDAQEVDITALEAGISVVVDAYGDSEADLLALEIRIVPPIGN